MCDQVYSNTRVPTQLNTNQQGSTRVWHESTRGNTNQHQSDTSPTRVDTSPTRVNTNQHESDTSQHESTRVNTTPTRVNTKQHEFKTGLDHEKETNMVKRKDKTWLNGGVEDCIYQDLGFFLKFMTNWTIENYFFYKGIYFIKRCIFIYLIFFQERSKFSVHTKHDKFFSAFW